MKTLVVTTCILVAAARILAADAKDTVKSAAKALGDKPNFSWKSTTENVGGGGGTRGGGPTDGKTEKGGYTHLTMVRGDNTIVAVLKGGKGVVKTADGWKTTEEASSDQSRQNPTRFLGRTLQNYKTPAIQAAELADEAKELKADDDVIAGALTEAGAKARITFGGGRAGGANAPEVRDAKGSVKFWVKDGVLAKYQYKVQGSITVNGNNRDIDRTTTVEIKDIGTTKIEVPEDAKNKL